MMHGEDTYPPAVPGLEAERDEWRERALRAEAHVRTVNARVTSLLEPPAMVEGLDFVRGDN